jgi:hypothetical protein
VQTLWGSIRTDRSKISLAAVPCNGLAPAAARHLLIDYTAARSSGYLSAGVNSRRFASIALSWKNTSHIVGSL